MQANEKQRPEKMMEDYNYRIRHPIKYWSKENAMPRYTSFRYGYQPMRVPNIPCWPPYGPYNYNKPYYGRPVMFPYRIEVPRREYGQRIPFYPIINKHEFRPVITNFQDKNARANNFYSMPEPPIKKPIEEPPKENLIPNCLKRCCNCDRSHCLKLYCDCFKSGHLCQDCNCKCCYNNLNYDKKRISAIKSALLKNKDAFKSVVRNVTRETLKTHHRSGCRCQKSNCLKRYCECFQNNVYCGRKCKCMGCKNTSSYRGEFDVDQEYKVYRPRKTSKNNRNDISNISISAEAALLHAANFNSIRDDYSNEKISKKTLDVKEKPKVSLEAPHNLNMADLLAVASDELEKLNHHKLRSKLEKNYEELILLVSNVLQDAVNSRSVEGESEEDISKLLLSEFQWCIEQINCQSQITKI